MALHQIQRWKKHIQVKGEMKNNKEQITRTWNKVTCIEHIWCSGCGESGEIKWICVLKYSQYGCYISEISSSTKCKSNFHVHV